LQVEEVAASESGDFDDVVSRMHDCLLLKQEVQLLQCSTAAIC
jgi:hypothetical protein